MNLSSKPPLTFWQRLYIPEILRGMQITLKNLLFSPKFTIEYPEEKRPMVPNFRGFPKLNMGDDGLPKCVACKLCEVVCPPQCITIEIGEYRDQNYRERLPKEFIIDYGKCINCGFCEEACPKLAIELSNLHELTALSRNELVFNLEKLLKIGEGQRNVRNIR